MIDAEGTQPARQLTREPGTNFIGEWIDDESILVAGREAGLWNLRRVSAATGAVTDLTAFREPRFYVRYPRWDPAARRVLFERHETSGRLWSLQLPVVIAGEPPARAAVR